MVQKDPEEIGVKLAESLDEQSLREESENNESGLLHEAIKSFEIQFTENQLHIQHDLLEAAFHGEIQTNPINLDSIKKSDLEKAAREYARHSLYGYANYFVDEQVEYSDLPNINSYMFAFKPEIIDGYWTDTAQVIIKQSMEDE